MVVWSASLASADLARARALLLGTPAARAGSCELLLLPALRLLLGGGLGGLLLGVGLLLLVRLLATLGHGLRLGRGDAGCALLLLLLDRLHELEVGRFAGVTEPMADADDARVAAVPLRVPG